VESKKKVKKSVKIVLLVIGILLATIIGLIAIFVIKDFQQEAILKKEIEIYANKDLVSDNFQIEIKTKGDYAYVEEAIKKYYKNLSDNVKEVNSYLNREEFTQILSNENIVKDHPDFTLSHATIQNVKEKMKVLLGNIEKLCDESTIKSLIDKEKLSDKEYYYDLYLDLMYSKDDLKELQELKNKMKDLSVTLNEFLDKMDEMLTYLQVNNSKIQYNEKAFFFTTEETLAGYKKLIVELQTIANKFTTGLAVTDKKTDTTSGSEI